jgi:hypothetical protein
VTASGGACVAISAYDPRKTGGQRTARFPTDGVLRRRNHSDAREEAVAIVAHKPRRPITSEPTITTSCATEEFFHVVGYSGVAPKNPWGKQMAARRFACFVAIIAYRARLTVKMKQGQLGSFPFLVGTDCVLTLLNSQARQILRRTAMPPRRRNSPDGPRCWSGADRTLVEALASRPRIRLRTGTQ